MVFRGGVLRDLLRRSLFWSERERSRGTRKLKGFPWHSASRPCSLEPMIAAQSPDPPAAGGAPVDLMVNVYQRTYERVLSRGFFPELERRNARTFARRLVVVNNVEDRSAVERLAQPLLAAGEIDGLVWVHEHLVSAMERCGWRSADFGGNPHYSDWALVAICYPGSRWCLCWDAEVELAGRHNWVDPATRLLASDPTLLVANPDWGSAQEESRERRDEFAIGYGFSDQVFLVDRSRLAQPIYHHFCPASWRYPMAYSGLVFEARVDAYMRSQRLRRATHLGVRYRHPPHQGSYPRPRNLRQRWRRWRNRWVLKAMRLSLAPGDPHLAHLRTPQSAWSEQSKPRGGALRISLAGPCPLRTISPRCMATTTHVSTRRGPLMEREVLPVEVLFVGAGPANLAAALHLARTQKAKGQEPDIAIIEKAQSVGGHTLSGAIMDPRAIQELFPDGWLEAGCPVEAKVEEEEVHHLSDGKSKKLPIVPPPLKNDGFYIVTLSDMVVWLKEKLEELEVMIFEGFPGHEVLMEGDKVIGVRTMDKGLDAEGNPGPNFEPGTDIHANVVVLGEGVRGSLTKQLTDKLGLQGENPQIYGTGCKEVWKLPEGRFPRGKVMHTSGWPLRNDQYGGSWIYGLGDDRVSIGFVTALDGGDPWLDPWDMFQRWKSHPKIREILEGGEILKAGAKTVPEGGYWSRPRSYGNGFLIIGDSASLLNISRLKGIHSAIKSGMMAADTILEAMEKNDFSATVLEGYEKRFQESWLKDELYRARNFRQEFKSGFVKGALKAGIKDLFGGKIGKDRIAVEEDYKEMKKVGDAEEDEVEEPATATAGGQS